MTRIPSVAVDVELRRELFLGIADLVHETKVPAHTLACWYSNTYSNLIQYCTQGTPHEQAEGWQVITRYQAAAVKVAEQYADDNSLQDILHTLASAGGTVAATSDNTDTSYQFFVQVAVYGRRYYTQADYSPDAFVSGQYLFLALSFAGSLRSKLEAALSSAIEPTPLR